MERGIKAGAHIRNHDFGGCGAEKVDDGDDL